MASGTIRRAISLAHRANLGEEPEQVEFQAGDKLTILKEWDDRYLCKNDGGQLFNVPKDCLEVG